MSKHTAHKVAQMLAEGFQSHEDELTLETCTLTIFNGESFDIEHDDGTVYLVTVTIAEGPIL